LQARIIRRVSLNEVRRRMTEIEKKYGNDLTSSPLQFAEKQLDKETIEDYVEWSMMFHAIRAYGEGEEFDYYAEETVSLGWSKISKLTPRRIELLDKLSRLQVRSINDLAVKTGRDVKNVYNDLQALMQLGFVKLEKRGRRTVPVLAVQEITLLLG